MVWFEDIYKYKNDLNIFINKIMNLFIAPLLLIIIVIGYIILLWLKYIKFSFEYFFMYFMLSF